MREHDGPLPLCQIAYTERFVEVHERFYAVLEKEEVSEEALALTEEVIDENSANYTAWWYRRRCLIALRRNLRDELCGFTTSWANKSLKNYQVWQHRRWIVEQLGDPKGELEFCADCLERDNDHKVYNIWAHRQWILRKFDLWESVREEELAFVNKYIDLDVRNNSAWNHRHTLILRYGILSDEWDFIRTKADRAPSNESLWNYALSVARRTDQWAELLALCKCYGRSGDEENRFALYCEAECLIHEKDPEGARVKFEALAEVDPIRSKYWNWKRDTL